MTPVPPIPPVPKVDEAMKLGAPAGAADPSASASPEMRQQFESLMQRYETSLNSESPSQAPKALGSMVDNEQNAMNDMQSSLTDMVEKMPTMNPMEMTMANMTLVNQASQIHMRMSLGLAVTKSSTKSLQSLLKNE